MHISLEVLLEDDAMMELMRKLLKKGNRGSDHWTAKRFWIPTNGSKKVLNNGTTPALS